MPNARRPHGPPSLLPWAQPYLAFAPEARLLQPGPDTLDPTGVLGVAVAVPADALVLQHQCVIYQACSGVEDIYQSQGSAAAGCTAPPAQKAAVTEQNLRLLRRLPSHPTLQGRFLRKPEFTRILPLQLQKTRAEVRLSG